MKQTGKMYTGILLVFTMTFALGMPASAEGTEDTGKDTEQETACEEILEDVEDEDTIVVYSEDDFNEITVIDETGDIDSVVTNPVNDDPEDTNAGDEEDADTEENVLKGYTGFWKDPDDGYWYYYTNGMMDISLTDVKKGTVDGKSGWWNVINGRVTKGETVAHNSNGWWYINSDGMVDFSYNGFAKNGNGSWYCEDGKVTFKKNGVLKDSTGAIGTKGTWYYVVGSKVQNGFTGLADYRNSNGWWYINNGKVTFDVNTVAQNKNGWYYVKDSKVEFSYNGFAENSHGWWYIESGQVTFKKNSVIKGTVSGDNAWWYVVGSKVQTSFTGLADYSNNSGWWYINNGKVTFDVNTVAQNKNGWYYVKDSKVIFSYNGFAENSHGWWYIESGKVTFKKNSVIKGTVSGDDGWWYIVGSKVQTNFTGLADYSNSNGWWYINNGKVDFNTNTVAKNKNGWYYVTGGKVQFGFTGLADYSNANGWWYIKSGKVDFSANTIAKNKNGWWYIKNGKVDFSAGDYSFAENTSQILDVQASGNTGTLTMYDKKGNSYTKVRSGSCYVGKNGVTSNKIQGDYKTPAGVYTLGQAFGVASDPGSTRDYLKVNQYHYWVGDSSSKYYNQLVDSRKTGIVWNEAEHLIDYPKAYKYAIAIDYNTSQTPNKGSAIFLHCSTGGATAGCVSVSESYMVKILQSLKTDTRIYIHKK